jgi:cell division protein FtsW
MMVFIPGIGFEAGGASRWIQLPFTGVQTSSMMVQPSEILKVIFLLYLAVWLEKRGSGVRNLAYGLLPFAFLLCVIVGLIIGQPDLGTVTIIVMTGIILYFIAGAPWKHLILLGVGGLVALGIVIQIAPYRAQRLMVFLNPGEDPQVAGYHINQSLLAIGSGGLFGVGLGHSRQKFNYLPEVTSDSIFAVIAEEFGFVLVVGLLLVFFTFLRKGMKIARDAPDAFGKYCAAGITVLIVMQASINIAALSGILPLTGITLPFISAGGSSLVAMMAGVGILANISRQTRP